MRKETSRERGGKEKTIHVSNPTHTRTLYGEEKWLPYFQRNNNGRQDRRIIKVRYKVYICGVGDQGLVCGV